MRPLLASATSVSPPSASSSRPPCLFLPLAYAAALKALVRELHSGPSAQEDGNVNLWAPTRRFFELPEARRTDLGNPGSLHRWSEEFF